jgi:acyl-coenzyme A synthetase/AMP-(fatty) acid ligase
VLRPGHVADDAMAQALQDFVKQTIAPYKYPRAVAFRDELPRTETGKLQRFKLPGAPGAVGQRAHGAGRGRRGPRHRTSAA